MTSISVTVTTEKAAIIEAAFQAIEKRNAKQAILDYIRNTVKNYLRQQKREELTAAVKLTLGISEVTTENQQILDSFLNSNVNITGIDFDPEG